MSGLSEALTGTRLCEFGSIAIAVKSETLPMSVPLEKILPAKLFNVSGVEEVFCTSIVKPITGVVPFMLIPVIVPG